MVSQIKINTLEEIKEDIVYPIYLQTEIEAQLINNLGYDLNKIVRKNCGDLTIIYTLGRYKFEKIIFVGLGEQNKVEISKIRQAFTKVAKQIEKDSVLYLKPLVNTMLEEKQILYTFIEAYLLEKHKFNKIGFNKKESIPNISVVSNQDGEQEIQKARDLCKCS